MKDPDINGQDVRQRESFDEVFANHALIYRLNIDHCHFAPFNVIVISYFN